MQHLLTYLRVLVNISSFNNFVLWHDISHNNLMFWQDISDNNLMLLVVWHDISDPHLCFGRIYLITVSCFGAKF